MEKIKRFGPVVIAVTSLLFLSFCSGKKGKKLVSQHGVYVDSMSFLYMSPDYAFEKAVKYPYLVSSCSYLYNDSVSNVLDEFDVDRLQELGFPERGFYDELPYERVSDTLAVSILYSAKRGSYGFGKMNLRNDTIFLRFAGTATMRSHKLPPTTRGLSPYVRTVFKIKIDSAVQYKVYFRMSDVDV